MSNILLLGSGTQGIALAKDIKVSGHRVLFIGERFNYADVSRYVDNRLYCSLDPMTPEYYKTVRDFIVCNDVDAIIPMGDRTAEFLSRNKMELTKLAHFEIPDYYYFMNGVDKNKLMSICSQRGYPHPFTINTVKDIREIDKELIPFPLLIKPNITCGARGMTLVNSYDELLLSFPAIQKKYGDCHLQQYIKQGGSQVEVQLLVENRRLVNYSVIQKYRWYPEKGGSSCCARSVVNEKIVDILYHLLLDLNWSGFADFDTIENPDTGELLIMELNPRVPACVKCAVEAGIHWGEIITNSYLHQPQKKYSYKEDIFLRHLGFEILWFVKSSNRFKTYPNWFKFFGKDIYYQDMSGLKDPFPFIVGTMRNVGTLLLHKK